MDFNQSFMSCDTIDGANCQTLFPRTVTQRDAAIEAVKRIGLPQIKEMDMSEFEEMQEEVMVKMIASSYDISDKKYIKPILECLYN